MKSNTWAHVWVAVTTVRVNTPETALRIITAAQQAAALAARMDYSRRVRAKRAKGTPSRMLRGLPVVPPIALHPASGVPLYAPPVTLPPLPVRHEQQAGASDSSHGMVVYVVVAPPRRSVCVPCHLLCVFAAAP